MKVLDLQRPPLPPFTYEDAVKKVRIAEDAWNTRDPNKIVLAYTKNTRWRNRSEFLKGRNAVRAFLERKWCIENCYRLIKELWAHTENRIAVRFCYEWHNAEQQWFRSYGNENWLFNETGHMAERHASINDVPIDKKHCKFMWPDGPRPADHPGLTELGL